MQRNAMMTYSLINGCLTFESHWKPADCTAPCRKITDDRHILPFSGNKTMMTYSLINGCLTFESHWKPADCTAPCRKLTDDRHILPFSGNKTEGGGAADRGPGDADEGRAYLHQDVSERPGLWR
jgi:hypothetical protein